MDLKNEFFAMLKSLSAEEKAELKSALEASEAPIDGEPADAEPTPEVTEPGAETTETAPEVTEPTMPSETVTDEQTPDEQGNQTSEAEQDDQMAAGEEEATTDEPIPPMESGTAAPDTEVEEQPPTQLQDDDGVDMPIDYQQIVEGLNARIMALEAENTKLKAKTEGAFGLTSMPSAGAKVNPLYNDTSDIPKIRK